eukprot:gnl/TRDRNA2_/TRDRNA2_187549_c0_seq1.p1 gnl/TRDRNA2_/TRDRNA2_187549_c0~~gnl/TRDRNA2_/TRDRNA2_187549_c0_seq1.p1  ORF type:complete len:269 (-),score=64.24 gnl/TRDRNA2_/TRDRNA2_187549_c0_seq1:98-796(-)
MVEYMKRVASMGTELTLEERNLLSVAYKNSVGARRSAWRAVHSMEQREATAGKSPQVLETIKDYRVKVESELKGKCNDILDILQKDLVPSASDPESRVFYLKMKGDYYRYLAEFASGDSHTQCAQDANDAYQAAWDIAVKELAPTHPIRLGLALNVSVFHYEVFGAPEKACALAKAAFDDAISLMDNLGEDQYLDSAGIMQLLKNNLTLWTTDIQNSGGLLPAQDGTAVEEL